MKIYLDCELLRGRVVYNFFGVWITKWLNGEEQGCKACRENLPGRRVVLVENCQHGKFSIWRIVWRKQWLRSWVSWSPTGKIWSNIYVTSYIIRLWNVTRNIFGLLESSISNVKNSTAWTSLAFQMGVKKISILDLYCKLDTLKEMLLH